jgi:hypothetical protein
MREAIEAGTIPARQGCTNAGVRAARRRVLFERLYLRWQNRPVNTRGEHPQGRLDLLLHGWGGHSDRLWFLLMLALKRPKRAATSRHTSVF